MFSALEATPQTETAPGAAGPGRRESRVAEVRRSGPSGNFWYAVELAGKLRRGQVLAVVWWKNAIALYRDDTGNVSALEDRCAHRQLPLSCGRVEGARLVCQYH